MVDRRSVGGWLGGPGSAYDARPAGDWPGERLGLPRSGPGSLAGLGRRAAALAVDWAACLLIAHAFSPSSWAPLLVFAAESVLLLPTLGATFGMKLLGLAVRSLRTGRPLLPLGALLRTVLLCLAVPAVVWDGDHRGLHDRAARSAVVTVR